MESSYQKTARDTVIIGVTTVLTFLLGLIQLPLMTKTLGAHDYGIWSMVHVTVGLILPLTNLGLIMAMIRFLAAEKNKEEIQRQFYSVVSVVFLISLAVSLVVILLAHPLAASFFDGDVQVVRITGILILLSSVTPVYLSLLRTFQQIKRYSIFLIAENLGRVGLIAYLVLNDYGILSVVISLVAVRAVILFVLFFSIKSQIGIGKPDFSRLKQYLSFGLPMIPRSLSFWLVNLSDRYVIGFFLGPTSVGVYSAAYGLGSLPYTIMAILTFVLMATLSQLFDEGRMDEVKTHLQYSLKYFLAIVIPFVLGAAMLAGPVLEMFCTAEIASDGRIILPLVALAVSLLGVYNIMSYILILAKRPKIMAVIWIIAAVVNIGLNIAVVPHVGIVGAAITTLIAYSLALGMGSYYSFKEFKFSIDWRFIIKSLIASGVMSLVLWRLAPTGNIATIVAVVIGVVVYAAILFLLKGFSKKEVKFFRRLFQRGTPVIDSDKHD